MAEYIKDNNGNVTHVRTITEDGSRSYLYRYDNNLFDTKTCVEIAEHDGDKTEAYHVNQGFLSDIFNGCRGDRK